MTMTQEKLERLFDKVRRLPAERQELAIEALSDIAADGVYALSDDERSILMPALERAKRREFASDADVDEMLNKPWA